MLLYGTLLLSLNRLRALPSDELLLDAYALPPQVGPAVVLAHTAVETRVAQTTDRNAILTGLNAELWSWLTVRSTAEQLDRLAKALTGKSLKDDRRLWEGFQHLREALEKQGNKFVHEGKAPSAAHGLQSTAAKRQNLSKALRNYRLAWESSPAG